MRKVVYALICGVIGASCSDPTPLPPTDEVLPVEAAGIADTGSAAPRSLLPPESLPLDYPFTLQHVAVADLDGDGLLDVTLTSRVEGRVETFYQQPGRRFLGSGALPDPGFHPFGTLAVTGSDGQPHLVLSAETANTLRVYRPQAGAPATHLGDSQRVLTPAESVVVEWPGWGATVAVSGIWNPAITLVRDFDPAHPDRARPIQAQDGAHGEGPRRGLAVADLQGSGIPSVLTAAAEDGSVLAIRPDEEGAVRIDPLWNLGELKYPHTLIPVDFDRDGTIDIFVLGEGMPYTALLRNDGSGRFAMEPFVIIGEAGEPGSLGGALTEERDGSLLLWSGGHASVVVLRWGADRRQPPERVVFENPGGDHMRFVAADLDGDGHPDLIVGSSVGNVPVTVLFGPLSTKLEAIGEWFAELRRQAEIPVSARSAAAPIADGG